MYIFKRFLIMVLTIWVIASLTFVIMKFIPGDPFASDSKRLPEEVLQNQRAKYHLDEPIPVQYVMYMKNLVTLDLGTSIQSDTRTVNSIIKQGAPVSALLGIQALIVALVFGLLFGIVAALHHNRFLDYST